MKPEKTDQNRNKPDTWLQMNHMLRSAACHPNLTEDLRDFQRPFTRPVKEVESWKKDAEGKISFLEVV
jgi:hypothetical protein